MDYSTINETWDALVVFTDPAIRGSLKVLNSSFMVALIGSAAGAFGAAWAIGKYEKRRKDEQTLASINIALTTLTAHLNTILSIKVHGLIAMQQEKDRIMEVVGLPSNGQVRQLNIHYLGMIIPVPDFGNNLNPAALAIFAGKYPQLLLYAMKSTETLSNFQNTLIDWNNLAKEMRESDPNKTPFFFGIRDSNGRADSRVPTVVDSVTQGADSALFFLRLASETIEKHAQEFLPKKLEKLIGRTLLLSAERFMPPRDFIKGWGSDNAM